MPTYAYEFHGHESLSNDIASRTRGGRQGVASGEQNAVPSSPWCAEWQWKMCFLLIQQGKGMDGDHKINPGDVVTLCKKTLSLNSCKTKMRFNKAKCASSTGGCSLWTTCTVDMRGYKYTKTVFVTAVFGKEWIWNFQESDRFQWCFVFFDLLFLCLQTSFCCSCVCAKLPHLKQQLCFKRLWQLLDWRNRKPFETKEYKETWFYTNTDTY